MKHFIKLLLLAAVLFSFACNKPSGNISGATQEASGWDMGKQTFTEFVFIQPTWQQSFYFALKDGYLWQLAVGLLLFAGAACFFILMTKKILDVKLLHLLGMMVLLAGSAAFVFTRPSTIKWNNTIKVEKEIYDKSVSDLPALWEDLYDNKRIVGTSGQ